jgi:hypothetical protein
MASSAHPRSPVSLAVWLAAAVAVVAALIAATHFSSGQGSNSVALSAANSRSHRPTACPTSTKKVTMWSKTGTYTDKHGRTQHIGDGAVPPGTKKGCPPPVAPTTAPATAAPTSTDPASTDPASTDPAATDTAAPTATATATTPPPLDILAKDCSKSTLPAHTGFQIAPACVSTAFGEVASQDNDASLLITNAPTSVNVGQTFTISVNTRNLVRDRFLAAGAGGYYVESSLLNDQGIVRGHFHTACRMLTSTTVAPDPAPVPAFFVATEDGKGSATPDTVQITVAGMPSTGTAQCSVWAGDGSHRIPMMQRANQIPPFDSVRIDVK